jgi:hypothetical protein
MKGNTGRTAPRARTQTTRPGRGRRLQCLREHALPGLSRSPSMGDCAPQTRRGRARRTTAATAAATAAALAPFCQSCRCFTLVDACNLAPPALRPLYAMHPPRSSTSSPRARQRVCVVPISRPASSHPCYLSIAPSSCLCLSIRPRHRIAAAVQRTLAVKLIHTLAHTHSHTDHLTPGLRLPAPPLKNASRHQQPPWPTCLKSTTRSRSINTSPVTACKACALHTCPPPRLPCQSVTRPPSARQEAFRATHRRCARYRPWYRVRGRGC